MEPWMSTNLPNSSIIINKPHLLLFYLSVFLSGKKKVSLYDSQAPICPICQVLLRPGELQEHMEQEMERLTHMHIR